MQRKQAVYEANGLTALMLTPKALRGNWSHKLIGQIESVSINRLTSFRSRRRVKASNAQDQLVGTLRPTSLDR
jgi:hypothetical protein